MSKNEIDKMRINESAGCWIKILMMFLQGLLHNFSLSYCLVQEMQF